MHRLFGTNGVRGITNISMTTELAQKLGKSVGTYFGGDIVLATDTRTSNDMFKNAVIAGLLSTGCSIFDAKIVPSPALQYYVKKSDADAGIIITASHNPPHFNGIKVVDANGMELSRNIEEEIETIYFNKKFHKAQWNEIGALYDVEIISLYIEDILSLVDVDSISEKKFKVVLDCGN